MLQIKNLWIETSKFPILRNINLKIERGKIKVILGESGAGKSTLGFFIAGILKEGLKARGTVVLEGRTFFPPEENHWKGIKAGIIFQDPYSFFDPRERIINSLKEVLIYNLKVSEKQAEIRALKWIQRVSFPEKYLKNFPHQLSGGLLQRASIASVLSLDPQILVADEPTSALDPPLRRGITELFKRVAKNRYAVYITHFVEEALEMGKDFLILYAGYAMEETDGEFLHPYSKLLLSSILKRGRDLKVPRGFSPHPSNLPEGCPFRGRCELENENCKSLPPLKRVNSSNLRCWNVS